VLQRACEMIHKYEKVPKAKFDALTAFCASEENKVRVLQSTYHSDNDGMSARYESQRKCILVVKLLDWKKDNSEGLPAGEFVCGVVEIPDEILHEQPSFIGFQGQPAKHMVPVPGCFAAKVWDCLYGHEVGKNVFTLHGEEITDQRVTEVHENMKF